MASSRTFPVLPRDMYGNAIQAVGFELDGTTYQEISTTPGSLVLAATSSGLVALAPDKAIRFMIHAEDETPDLDLSPRLWAGAMLALPFGNRDRRTLSWKLDPYDSGTGLLMVALCERQ